MVYLSDEKEQVKILGMKKYKIKYIIIGLIVLSSITLAYIAIREENKYSLNTESEGVENFIPNFQDFYKTITNITIIHGNKKTDFVKKADNWFSGNDNKTITIYGIFNSLADLKIIEKKTNDKANFSSFSLDEKAPRIILKDINNQVKLDLVLGKLQKAYGSMVLPNNGFYIRKFDESQVYLVKSSSDINIGEFLQKKEDSAKETNKASSK